jgi:hypothetical protein
LKVEWEWYACNESVNAVRGRKALYRYRTL